MSDVSENALRQATVLVQMRRFHEAVPLLQQAIASEPGSARPRCLLAQCLLAVGDRAGALEAASGAVAAAPEYEWGHRLRSLALMRLKRNQEALDAARQAVALAPLLESTYLVLSQAELALRHMGPAQAAAEKARELAPESPDAHNQLGLVSLRRARASEAEQHFRTALAQDPQHPEAMNNLGVALLRQGHRPQAIHYFGEASKLNPQMSVARRNAAGAARVGVPILLGAVLVGNAIRLSTSGTASGLLVAALALACLVLVLWRRFHREPGPRPDDPKASKELVRALRRDPSGSVFGNVFFVGWLALLLGSAGLAALIGGIDELPEDQRGWLAIVLGLVACTGAALVVRGYTRRRRAIRA
jgi:tetratricopeptide (TPR) repeat protein